MEQMTPRTSASGPRTRRDQARAEAFSSREHYRTPDWLERSFVLPVDETPEQASAALSERMPSQPRPTHDDVTAFVLASLPRHAPAREWPGQDAPTSSEIDFAGVVRRSDACRLARRTALFTLALTVLVLASMLLTGSTTVLPLLAVTGSGCLAAALVLHLLRRAPIPVRRG